MGVGSVSQQEYLWFEERKRVLEWMMVLGRVMNGNEGCFIR